MQTSRRLQKHVRDKFGVKFPLMSKVDVKEEHAHPVWKYLKSELSIRYGLYDKVLTYRDVGL